MRELGTDGEPIKASTFDWRAKGFDGFLGYGYDEETGDCCPDCICDDNCLPEEDTSIFFLHAYWFDDCKDLDLSVKFGDKVGGFGCANNSAGGGFFNGDCINEKEGGHQICWGSDNTSLGGYELFFIRVDWNKFEQEKVLRNQKEYFYLKISAHWHTPAYESGCSGNFDLFMTPCGQEPYGICNAEGEINTPFLQKKYQNYQMQFSGCSDYAILDLYFNKSEILAEPSFFLDATDFDPRGSGKWYMME